jgi:hypothetical protein
VLKLEIIAMPIAAAIRRRGWRVTRAERVIVFMVLSWYRLNRSFLAFLPAIWPRRLWSNSAPVRGMKS